MSQKEQYERALAKKLSELIAEMNDPRIPMIVTVERVRLSADLSSAKVLVSALSDESPTELEAALNGASGHLQRGIGRDLKAKKTPRLSFHVDPLAVI